MAMTIHVLNDPTPVVTISHKSRWFQDTFNNFILNTVIEETRNMWGQRTVREDDIRTAEVSLDDGERGWVMILIGSEVQGYRVWGSCEGGPITSQDVADIMERGETYGVKISGVWKG